MKTCGQCDRVKPFSEFGIDRNRKDNLRRECKGCDNANRRKHDAIRQRACDRLGLTNKKSYKYGGLENDWVSLSEEEKKNAIIGQQQIDRENLESGHVKECPKCFRHFPTTDHGCVCRNRGDEKKPHNTKNNPKRMYVDGKYIPATNPLHTPGQFDRWDDVPVEPNKQTATPLSKPRNRSEIRPTKKQPVPRARWGQSPQRDRLYTEATSRMLRRNKWAERDTCELRLRGPFENLEFCHILSIAACKKSERLDWAEDDNNGFLLWAALNGPMERGFHWEMDGPCAFYVPPEGGDYYDWMKVLHIHTLWIEPTPEQLKYILLAADYATGIPLYSKE